MHERVSECSSLEPHLGSTSVDQRHFTPTTEIKTMVPATVAEFVTAQAFETPEGVAVAGEKQSLSYAELEARASQLAHHLRSLGAGPEKLVVLCLERSAELVVSALAVLKTGAAYVPLDPSWPQDRLQFMLRDCGSALVITRQGVAARLPKGNWRIVDLDSENDQISRGPISFPPVPMKQEAVAYVIYTSGSTGQPKGVEVTHGGLLNLVSWHLKTFSVGASDRATLFASPGFDASVWEIWPYLCAGASLHVPDESLRTDAAGLRDWLVGRGITISFIPTVLAELMLALPWPAQTALRTMLTGADTLHRCPPAGLPFTFVNNYGPTECTVVATSGTVPNGGTSNEQPTIGRAITNVQAFIVDEQLNAVPAGTAGELLLGGASLARGYLNQPALTAEKFIANPFSSAPGSRLYRTGDVVRLLPNGEIAFLGRTDDQIKIRGFRIEPGEIVTALNRHTSILASSVMARSDEGAEKKLVAYVVSSPGTHLELAELRSFLLKDLPEYMVPAVFVALNSLPMTSNGKVDRAALPAPNDSNMLRNEASTEAQTPVESRVAEIVASLLGLPQVGANDNFFLLGGHSLLATQVIARVRDAFDVDLSLRMLFEAPTVAELSAEIDRLLLEKLESMTDEEAQRRLNALAS
jgi:amino acid adenylation domain-containing protein